jgi:hypothetical protein
LWYNAPTILPATGQQLVELIEIINKSLLLHLVGCFYYHISIPHSLNETLAARFLVTRGGLRVTEERITCVENVYCKVLIERDLK